MATITSKLLLIWGFIKKIVHYGKRVGNLWKTVKPTVKHLSEQIKRWARRGEEQKKPD